MPLSHQLEQIEPIASLIVEEHRMIRCLRCQGEPPAPEAEARAYAAALAMPALMLRPLQMKAIELETASAWVA